MNKSSNILLIVVVILLTYLSVVQTAIYFKKEDNQFLPLDMRYHDYEIFEEFPPLKVDAQTGVVYELKRTKAGKKWVKR